MQQESHVDKVNDITFNDTIFLNSCEVNKKLEDENHAEQENKHNENKKNTKCDEEKQVKKKNILEDSIVNTQKRCSLSAWDLPESILTKYKNRGLTEMFHWQAECLSNPKVLTENSNLVYSAPTSAGKTLVAEILAIKTVLERHKKVIVILPFVSVVREKMFYFQDILSSSDVRVEGFMGSHNPPGGFKMVQLAICTIEKANGIINKLLEEKTIDVLGAVVVDEMHLLGDPSRGYLLELLLTKLRYMCARNKEISIQLIGMSATLPNLSLLAKWLDAELYTTDFRPIPLKEFCIVNGEIYNHELNLERRLEKIPDLSEDTDNILQICLETISTSCSVLIFCPTKNWCENLAQQISVAFCKLGRTTSKYGQCLRKQLNTGAISEILEQLRRCPVGLDSILKITVSFGVAFHHAGLTMDERDIIEGAFRSGALRILVATSTLSSGVNLPARRVIIRTPMFHGRPIDTLTYRQMIGRAGRMGKDSAGESILICQRNDRKIASDLMSAKLQPIESCLEGAGKLKRAILEVIASGVASSPEDVSLFASCTLLATSESEFNKGSDPIGEAVEFLTNNEFIRLQNNDKGELQYVPTSLAKACLSSSLPPEDGLALFEELEKARQCLVLDTELHLLYLVTPYSACNQWRELDWMLFLDMWERLPMNMRRVADMVGVNESFIFNSTRGKVNTSSSKMYHRLQIHRRFYTALALQDLVNEVPLNKVADKFQCSRGMLQSLQQSASTFAGMVTAFSRQLGWTCVEILITQFQDRLQFGIHHDLLDLMKLPLLNGPRARALYNANVKSLVDLAACDVCGLENVLHSSVPFQSEKEREGETAYDVKEKKNMRSIWITGKEGLTAREAAEMLIEDARKYLQLEIGVAVVKWNSADTTQSDSVIDTSKSNSSTVSPDHTTNHNSKNRGLIQNISTKLSADDSKTCMKNNISIHIVDNLTNIGFNSPDSILHSNNQRNAFTTVTNMSISLHKNQDNTDKSIVHNNIRENGETFNSLKTNIKLNNSLNEMLTNSIAFENIKEIEDDMEVDKDNVISNNEVIGNKENVDPNILMKDGNISLSTSLNKMFSNSISFENIEENQADMKVDKENIMSNNEVIKNEDNMNISMIGNISLSNSLNEMLANSISFENVQESEAKMEADHEPTMNNVEVIGIEENTNCNVSLNDSNFSLSNSLNEMFTDSISFENFEGIKNDPNVNKKSITLNRILIKIRKNEKNIDKNILQHNISFNELLNNSICFEGNESCINVDVNKKPLMTSSKLIEDIENIDPKILKNKLLSNPLTNILGNSISFEDVERIQNCVEVNEKPVIVDKKMMDSEENVSYNISVPGNISLSNSLNELLSDSISFENIENMQNDVQEDTKSNTNNNVMEIEAKKYIQNVETLSSFKEKLNQSISHETEDKIDIKNNEMNEESLNNNFNFNWTVLDVEKNMNCSSRKSVSNQENGLLKDLNSPISLNNSIFNTTNESGSLFEDSMCLDTKMCNILDTSMGNNSIASGTKGNSLRLNTSTDVDNIPESEELMGSPDIFSNFRGNNVNISIKEHKVEVRSLELSEKKEDGSDTLKMEMNDSIFQNAFTNSFNLKCDGLPNIAQDIQVDESPDVKNVSDVVDTSQTENESKHIHSIYNSINKSSRKVKDNGRKRRKKEKDDDSFKVLETPKKKKCIKNLKNELNIIDICESKFIFEKFTADIAKQSTISVSIGCERYQIKKNQIGQKIIKSSRIKQETTKFVEQEFVYGSRKMCGVAISWGANTVYYTSFINNESVSNNEKILLLRNVFSNNKLKIRIYDSKEQYKILFRCCGIRMKCYLEDPKIADWLLEPEGKEKSLPIMASKYSPDTEYITKMIEDYPKYSSVALDADNSALSRSRASVEAFITWHVAEAQNQLFLNQDVRLLNTFSIEMSNIHCLAEMEIIGLGVDTSKINDLTTMINEQMAVLQKQAFKLAGRRFSFTSSKDVAKVLGIYKGKKVSTNKQVLEHIEDPLSNLVVQWRKLNFIQTKMLFPLLQCVKENRIYGCCITRSVTGRISMHEPNLQSIPRNFDLAMSDNTVIPISVRASFVPIEGNIFISADFCQLELRLLAHFSQDAVLCDIMRSEEDIFKSIASKVYNVPSKMVHDVLRQRAKQLCYGIIYGMGAKALSEQLQSTEEDAKEFMESFICTYPAIKIFVQKTVDVCREKGYVETLAGRRRYLPHINNQCSAIKSQAERQAVNTTVQGSAADLVKKAMILTDTKLRKYFPLNHNSQVSRVALVLHIHDELLYEVPQADLKNATKVIKHAMESAMKLSIPFPVKLKSGISWGELIELN